MRAGPRRTVHARIPATQKHLEWDATADAAKDFDDASLGEAALEGCPHTPGFDRDFYSTTGFGGDYARIVVGCLRREGEDLGFGWGDQPRQRTTLAMLLCSTGGLIGARREAGDDNVAGALASVWR